MKYIIILHRLLVFEVNVEVIQGSANFKFNLKKYKNLNDTKILLYVQLFYRIYKYMYTNINIQFINTIEVKRV